MKITQKETKLVTGTEMESEDFEIGDLSLVMELLRSKMYTNPIRTIAQEIMSNARDAHREHGNPERPILVKIPNSIDEEFWIRDFGVGIDPDRMSNVFIKYGVSTKRGGNDQTGGFGLGAKSPWAYADNFQIETYLPDDKGQMQRRRYAAVLGEQRNGQLLKIDGPEPTKEERGTKIIVQVRDGDADYFTQWVEDRARYWEPRPEVVGDPEFEWEDVTPLFEGEDWMMVDGGNGRGLVLNDGIPYPVDANSIYQPGENDYNSKSPIRLAFQMGFVIKVKTGDIQVAATREGIDYDKGTVAEIRKRLKKMMEEVGDVVAESIENAGSLWEANRIFKGLPDLPRQAVRGKAQWNGIPVAGDFSLPGRLGFKVIQFDRKYAHGKDVGTKSISGSYFTFHKDDERTYLMDEENVQRGRALYLFRTEDRSDVERVRLIYIPKSDNPDVQKEIDEALDEAEQKHGLKTLIGNLEDFSTVEKWNPRKHGPKTSTGNGGPRSYGGPVIRVKEIDHADNGWRWAESETSFDDEEVVFVQLYGGKPFMAPNKEMETHLGTVKQIEEGLGVKVAGVQTPFIGKVPEDWVWLRDAVAEKYKEVVADPDYAAALELEDTEHHFENVMNRIDDLFDNGKLTLPANGLLAQWRDESAKQEELRSTLGTIEHWESLAQIPESDRGKRKPGKRLENLRNAVKKTMPFVEIINDEWYHIDKKSTIAELQWYIDAKDPARDKGNDPQAAVDKQAYDLYKGNGGTLSYAQIEKRLAGQPGIKDHNGNAARRAVKRHEKALGLVA
jgi:hypothetical protein